MRAGTGPTLQATARRRHHDIQRQALTAIAAALIGAIALTGCNEAPAPAPAAEPAAQTQSAPAPEAQQQAPEQAQQQAPVEAQKAPAPDAKK
ncbi:MAG: hypothetical protein ACLTS9_06025 [Sutterella wadsworthensis]